LSNLFLLSRANAIKVGASLSNIPSNSSRCSKSVGFPKTLNAAPTLSSNSLTLLNNSLAAPPNVYSTGYSSFNSVLSALLGSFTTTLIYSAVTLCGLGL